MTMAPQDLAAITWRHINMSVPYTGGKDILVDGWMNQADHDLEQLIAEVKRLRGLVATIDQRVLDLRVRDADAVPLAIDIHALISPLDLDALDAEQ